MTFISRIFDLGIIHEFLNSRGTDQLTEIAILNQLISILARTLNSRGPGFANISENKVLANISESTVLLAYWRDTFRLRHRRQPYSPSY